MTAEQGESVCSCHGWSSEDETHLTHPNPKLQSEEDMLITHDNLLQIHNMET